MSPTGHITPDRKTTVYRFYGADDQPIYVGTSRGGSKRLSDHGRKDWWPEVAYAWFDHYDDQAEALAVERHLIESLRPKYNERYRIPTDSRPPVEVDAA